MDQLNFDFNKVKNRFYLFLKNEYIRLPKFLKILLILILIIILYLWIDFTSIFPYGDKIKDLFVKSGISVENIYFSSNNDFKINTKNNNHNANEIEINDIKMLKKENGGSFHDFEYLYTFELTGTYNYELNRRGYSLVVYYKFLGQKDNRYGWYCVNKLDYNGFEYPNSMPLDEYSNKSWKFITSRFYVDKELNPPFAFIVFIVPNKFVTTKLSDNNMGWGKESLNSLKKINHVIYSPIKIYEHN